MPREAEVVRGDFVFGSVRGFFGDRARSGRGRDSGIFFSLSLSPFVFSPSPFLPFSLLFFWQISCFLL